MAVAVVDLPVPSQQRSDCDCARQCFWRPSRIAVILRMMDEMAQSGYEPCESLMDALVRETTPEAVDGESIYARHSAPFGPSEPSGAKVVADIQRAIRAGKRTPVEMAEFLCPLALVPEAPEEPSPVARPTWIGRDEAMRRLGYSQRWFYHLIRQHGVRHTGRLGEKYGPVIFCAEDIDEVVRRTRGGAVDGASGEGVS